LPKGDFDLMLQILQVKNSSQVEKKCESKFIFIYLALFPSFWTFNWVFWGLWTSELFQWFITGL